MSKQSLQLVDGLRLSIELLMQPIALLGNKGSGKTYAGLKLFEQAHQAGVQCIWFDPVSKAYGLRLGPDGKPNVGLKDVYIFGGKRGDFPLEASRGAFVAKLLVERRVSVVLDLSQFRKGARKQFITDFLEEFYHLKVDKDDGLPTLMFFEEAHLVLPQRPMKGDERMLGAVEDVVLLGRNCGIGTVLMDQRPAHVNKSCLAETEVLLALRTTYPLDRKVYREWIADKGAQEIDLDAELPELKAGEGFLWAPTEKIFKRAQVLPRETYDSSATARIGGRRRAVGKLSKVDVGAIAEEMRVVSEEAARTNPAKLLARIAELEKELAVRSHGKTFGDAIVGGLKQAASKPLLSARDLKKLEALMKQGQLTASAVHKAGVDVHEAADFCKSALDKATQASVEFREAAVALGKLYNATPHETRAEEKNRLFGKRYSTDTAASLAAMKAGVPAAKAMADYFESLKGQRVTAVVENGKATSFALEADGRVHLRGEVPDYRYAPVKKVREPRSESASTNGDFKPYGKMEEMLRALANRPLSRDDLACVTGQAQGGTFRAYVGRLKTAGLVDERTGQLALTDTAYAAYGEMLSMPLDLRADEILARNAKVVYGKAAEMVRAVQQHRDMTRDQLAEAVGVAQGGTFRAYVGRLKSRGILLESHGHLALSPIMLNGGA